MYRTMLEIINTLKDAGLATKEEQPSKAAWNALALLNYARLTRGQTDSDFQQNLLKVKRVSANLAETRMTLLI